VQLREISGPGVQPEDRLTGSTKDVCMKRSPADSPALSKVRVERLRSGEENLLMLSDRNSLKCIR